LKIHYLDIVVLGLYCALILFVGLYVSRKKGENEKNSSDYFLASKSLPWWAIGASLIAANISAEQFIGMSGSGFAVGLAIASYEWMAAITILLVGKYFLPIYMEKGIYTIPQFLEKRYNHQVKSILAVFWVMLFVFVNLTSVLYLGAMALDTVLGNGDGALVIPFIIALALFAAAYSLYGGLAAVAWTDVIQVVLLIVGGLITTFIALSHVDPNSQSVLSGLSYVYEKVPEKFEMILDPSHPEYVNLPGIAVLVGGLWIANIYYWGFNQYIIQRTLAAKSIREAQKGIVFAAILKLILPLIVVVPGIIAFVMYTDNPSAASEFVNAEGLVESDKAYPWLIATYMPVGLKGLVLAALTAAIASSVASMVNSTSTIFTMDIYKPFFNKKATESNMVKVGRFSGLIALLVAILIAPFLGSIPQAFQYIQEYTGIVSPGILAIFILGLFWRKTTTKAAVVAAFVSIAIAMYFKIGQNGWIEHPAFPNLPWMHQMGITFLLTVLIMVVISLNQNKGADDAKGIRFGKDLFKTSPLFNVLSFAVILILIVLYSVFW
jgi:SSS family solute:Na+ symporter